jgi:hypothetical protein
MSEEKLSSSKKLDIEGAQRSSATEEKIKETYKQISEDIGLAHGESLNPRPSYHPSQKSAAPDRLAKVKDTKFQDFVFSSFCSFSPLLPTNEKNVLMQWKAKFQHEVLAAPDMLAQR